MMRILFSLGMFLGSGALSLSLACGALGDASEIKSALEPRSISECVETARGMLYRGDLPGLKSFLRQAKQLEASNPDLLKLEGLLELCHNRLQDARVAFELAIEAYAQRGDRQERADLYRRLGYLYYELKEYAQAVASFDQCRKLGGHINAPFIALLRKFGSERPYQVTLSPSPTVLSMETVPVPMVSVSINGKGPFRFVVDTGAGISVVSSALLSSCKIETLSDDAEAYGAGGNGVVPIRLGRVRELRIGEVIVGNVPVAVMDTERLKFNAGSDLKPLLIDGILGLPLLKEFLLTLDFGKKQLRLGVGNEEDVPSSSGETEFFMAKDQVYIPVAIEGKQVLNFFVDTGANVSSITEYGVRELNLPDSRLIESNKNIWGTAGEREVEREFIPAWVQIAGRDIRNPVLIMEHSGPPGQVIKRDGVVGNDVMAGLKVTFNFRKMRIRLE